MFEVKNTQFFYFDESLPTPDSFDNESSELKFPIDTAMAWSMEMLD